MEYDFDAVITDIRGTPLKMSEDSDVPAKIGEIIANALMTPDQAVRSNFAARLNLAQRVDSGGKGKLKTDERKWIIDSAVNAYGQFRPLLAGLIEQFIEGEGAFALDDSGNNGPPPPPPTFEG